MPLKNPVSPDIRTVKFEHSGCAAMAAAIASALEESDEIAFEHTVDSELEDGGVLIRHIFDCEVW